MQDCSDRAVLVLTPFHDNVPHRFHLRISQGMTSEEVMSQILLQLVPVEQKSESSPYTVERKSPYDITTFELFFTNPKNFTFLVPFGASAFLAQPASPMLLMHYSQSCVASMDQKTNDSAFNDGSTLAEHSISSVLPTELMPLPSVPVVEERISPASLELERFARSNRVMLYIVGEVLSELAIQAGTDCDLTPKSWPTMMSMALEKENTSLDKLDPCIVEEFKKTLLSSLSRGKKLSSLSK